MLSIINTWTWTWPLLSAICCFLLCFGCKIIFQYMSHFVYRLHSIDMCNTQIYEIVQTQSLVLFWKILEKAFNYRFPKYFAETCMGWPPLNYAIQCQHLNSLVNRCHVAPNILYNNILASRHMSTPQVGLPS